MIRQARRHILEGQKVPSEEKVPAATSRTPGTIPRHQGDALVAFGRQVILDEVEGGIMTRSHRAQPGGGGGGASPGVLRASPGSGGR
jgi:hypothetical protein